MTFKIEKGVPVPPIRAVLEEYPFGDMDVGDSFLVPIEEGKSPSQHSALVKSRAYNICRIKYPYYECSVRKVEGGARVWRTK